MIKIFLYNVNTCDISLEQKEKEEKIKLLLNSSNIVTTKPIVVAVDPTIDGFYIRGFKQTYNDNIFLKNESINPSYNSQCEYIDLVYTWVNGSDPKNIMDSKKYFKSKDFDNNKLLKESTSDGRYRDYGLLKYSLRSVRKNVPWIRKIFIITANQIPTWFNSSNSDNVEFIFHEDYFYNKSHLPTFNSNSIESNFFNLPEKVSNCFLYCNDDIFFSKPVKMTEFFDKDYNLHIFQRKQLISSFTVIPKDPGYIDSFQFTCMVYNNRHLDKIWFTTQRYRSDHGVLMFNKNILKMIHRDLPEYTEYTSSNRFRDTKEMSVAFTHLQYAKRYATFQVKPSQNAYYALREYNIDEIFNEINSTVFPFKTVCLNDVFERVDDTIISKIDNFFNYHFPNPSPFENKI